MNDQLPPNDDEAVYEKVWSEIEDGTLNRGLWARCYAEADGDEEKAKARYIKARVAQLSRADEARQAADMQRLRAQQRTEREAQERKRAEIDAQQRREREEKERQAALKRQQEQHERLRDERRRGVHGEAAREEQEEQDLRDVVESARRHAKVNPVTLEAQKVDHWGCTRLIRAAQAGRYEEIVRMVADGDDPSYHDASGMSARAHSEVRNHAKCRHFLEVAERVWDKHGKI